MLAIALFATLIGASFAAIGVDVDRDGRLDYVIPSARGAVVEPAWGSTWSNGWGVRDDWRNWHDWNRDGVVDWRDDWWLAGERPWSGDWARADWNRDGVIDWQDGWRRLDDTWAVGAVNGALPVGSWRPEGTVVREVPATGIVDDWRYVDGPWTVPEWGYGWNGIRPATEVIVDDWALRSPVTTVRSDAIYDDRAWRDGYIGDWDRPVVKPAARTATTTKAKPTTTATKTAAKPTATKKAATTTTKKVTGTR